MTLPAPAQTTPENAAEPTRAEAPARPSAEDPAVGIETVAIELNFNAFADHVPPTQHARRVAKPSDPSLQDFADQALELAALRAELKRLTRDYETSQNALRVREMRLQAMQDELAIARSGLRNTTQQLSNAQSQLAAMSAKGAKEPLPAAVEVVPTPQAVDAPQAPAPSSSSAPSSVSASEPEAPETPTLELPDLSQTIPDMSSLAPECNVSGRRLMPLDHIGAAVPLSREIMTIGRTRANDICISSGAVSRDHARLLVTPRSVTIVDMNSANGCFVNDERVNKHRLRNGDVLRVGDRSYRFIDGSG